MSIVYQLFLKLLLIVIYIIYYLIENEGLLLMYYLIENEGLQMNMIARTSTEDSELNATSNITKMIISLKSFQTH